MRLHPWQVASNHRPDTQRAGAPILVPPAALMAAIERRQSVRIDGEETDGAA